MLPKGDAKKITISLNQDTRTHMEPLWPAILAFLRHKHVAGATLFRAGAGFGTHEQFHNPQSEYIAEHCFSGATAYRGILGFGAKGHTHRAGRFHLSHDLPVMISAVETPELVAGLVRVVAERMQEGVIVTSDVELRQIVHQLPASGELASDVQPTR